MSFGALVIIAIIIAVIWAMPPAWVRKENREARQLRNRAIQGTATVLDENSERIDFSNQRQVTADRFSMQQIEQSFNPSPKAIPTPAFMPDITMYTVRYRFYDPNIGKYIIGAYIGPKPSQVFKPGMSIPIWLIPGDSEHRSCIAHPNIHLRKVRFFYGSIEK